MTGASGVHRYAVLDGVRGFAALSVLAFHLGHWLDAPRLATNGGLAVDLFFCLSGFVLAFAYGEKTRQISFRRFAAIRLVRLMPLIVLGGVVSAAYALLRASMFARGAHVDQSGASGLVVGLALALGVLNLPYFGAPAAVGGPELFPLNGPQFSLFFEIFANLAWWAGRGLPQVPTALATILVCAPAVAILGIGGDTAQNFLAGFPRVLMCFASGVLVFHLDRRLGERKPYAPLFWLLLALTAGIFYLPVEASLGLRLAWTLGLVPLLVLSGARVRLSPAHSRLALKAGALSYPVYALHYPLFCWLNGVCQVLLGRRNIAVEAPLTLGVVLLAAFLADKFYDAPVRSLLSRRLRIAAPRKPLELAPSTDMAA